MALTPTQVRHAFEICDAIYSTSAQAHDGYRKVFTWPDAGGVQTALTTVLNGLDSDTLTEVTNLIASWDTIRGFTMTLNGSVGSISGISYDPEKDRERIKELFLTYVPVFSIATGIKHKADMTQPSTLIPMLA